MKNNKRIYLCSIIYKILIDILYAKGTSVKFAYLNRTLDFNLDKYILGWIVFIILLILINKIKKDDYRFMMKSIFMLSGVSNLSIFGLRNYDYSYFGIILIFWLLIVNLCILISNNKKKDEIETDNNLVIKDLTLNKLNTFLMIVGILITVYLVGKFGMNVTSLSTLYKAREYFRTFNLSTIDSYLISWNATVILPWIFLISFANKKYFRSIIVLFFALLLFQINGMKTWLLLYAIVVFFVTYTKKHDLDSTINAVLIGMSCLMLFSLLLFKINGSYDLLALLDRTVILPGEINYYYIDFFNNHELLYLRESIFKSFSPSPYDPISSVQISMNYMTNAYYHNATNGLVGDIYGNFGFIGILIYPFMILLAFKQLVKICSKYSITIKSVILFILMWMLINTSFFTWIMTGGYLIYIIILRLNKRIYLK